MCDKNYKNNKHNASGCLDLTAHKAIKNVSEEENRFNKLLRTIFYITELAGFEIEGRIVLIDKKLEEPGGNIQMTALGCSCAALLISLYFVTFFKIVTITFLK